MATFDFNPYQQARFGQVAPPPMQPAPVLPPGLPPEQAAIANAASKAGIPNEVIEGVGLVATGTAVAGPVGGAVGLGIAVGKFLGSKLFSGKSLYDTTLEVLEAVKRLPSIKQQRDVLLGYRKTLTSHPMNSGSISKMFDVPRSVRKLDDVLLRQRPPAGLAPDVPGFQVEQFQRMTDAQLIGFIDYQNKLLDPAVLAARPELSAPAIQDSIFTAQSVYETRRPGGAVAGLLAIEPFRRYRPESEAFGVRDAYLEGLDTIAGAVAGAWEGTRWLWGELRPHLGVSPEAQAFTLRQAYGTGLEGQGEISGCY